MRSRKRNLTEEKGKAEHQKNKQYPIPPGPQAPPPPPLQYPSLTITAGKEKEGGGRFQKILFFLYR
jgi:hypothetical protein